MNKKYEYPMSIFKSYTILMVYICVWGGKYLRIDIYLSSSDIENKIQMNKQLITKKDNKLDRVKMLIY